MARSWLSFEDRDYRFADGNVVEGLIEKDNG